LFVGREKVQPPIRQIPAYRRPTTTKNVFVRRFFCFIKKMSQNLAMKLPGRRQRFILPRRARRSEDGACALFAMSRRL
jgi:hypothetical protein